MSKKIVIDPGHGGEDSGAIGNGLQEKDLNLKVSKYLKKRFDDLGISSKLTREDDKTLPPKERVDKILSFYGNGNDVIVLSNHINAGGGDGAEVIYALRNTDNLSKNISKELENAGQNVRKYYQRRLPSDTSKDYYFIHRDTSNTEPLIIEYAFIDSTGDDIKQLNNDLDSYGEAVVKAVANYIGVKYVPVITEDMYIVSKGDSLWSISKKFGLSVDELKSLNNLTNNLLSIGQILKIKESSIIEDNIYYVEKGDTLYKIASIFNTTVSKIKDINNLNSDILSINQKLIIPNDYQTYTVVKGDTLYGISRKFNTTVSLLSDLNNLSTPILNIGQKLLIP